MNCVLVAVSIIIAYLCGFYFGKRSCPNDNVWLEATKYKIDKEWEYINRLKNEENERGDD